jgi:hypothetical protein
MIGKRGKRGKWERKAKEHKRTKGKVCQDRRR